jgi:16S rRNA (cytosine1402-N4)-methyltransferase
MDKLLSSVGINKVDGILLDLGVSSMQLDEAERGFSFRSDAALDMRMESKGRSAADLVNTLEEKELADIIYYNGGEKKSRYIARAIVEERAIKPITRTIELAELVKKAVRSYNDTIHPATRTFQALRMEVNNELGELRSALAVMPQLLEKNGRLAVITFHSGEDELVKEYIRNRSGQVPNVSRYLPETETTLDITFKPLGRKAFLPSEDEIKNNPRARSAKLRGAMKLH